MTGLFFPFRLFAVLFVFSLAFAPNVTFAQSQVLSNPGFEGAYAPISIRPNATGDKATIDGEVANGWEDNSTWAGVTAVYSRESAGMRGGSLAQKIELSAVTSGQLQIVQSFRGSAGTRARGSVWVKGSPGAKVGLQLRQAAPPYEGLGEASITLSDQWQELRLTTFIERNDDYLFLVTFGTPGTLWIDDASLSIVAGGLPIALPAAPIAKKQFGMHLNYFADSAVNNPGFEGPYGTVTTSSSTITGKIAPWWQDNSDWADVTIEYNEERANVRSGSSAQKIDVKAVRSGGYQIVRNLRLPKNRSYTASVWLRGTPGAEVELALAQGGEPYATYGAKRVTLTDTWQQVTTQGRVETGDNTALMIRGNTALTVWVDDVSVVDEAGNALVARFPDVNFGTLRLWDAGVTWAKLEPEKGRFDFTMLDRFVSEAQSRGQEVILTLGQSPTWASARPTTLTYLGLGASAEPANLADWRDYVTAVASRYKGRIQYYEVWNEPNDTTFFSGTVNDAIALTREAKSALTAADPNAKLISAPPYVVGWLDQFLAGGGGQYVDIIGYHVYADEPEQMARGLADIRLVLEERGVWGVKPLWNTEGAVGDRNTSEDVGVGFIARAYLINFIYGAERYAWYNWGGPRECASFCTPTVTDNIPEANRVGRAFGAIQEWLVGKTMKRFEVNAAGVYQLELQQANGQSAWIVWQPRASASFAIPAAWRAQSKRELEGGASSLNGATSVQVGATPIMIEAAPPPAAAGDGLTACYFNNVNFTAPVLSRIDPQIDFNWSNQSPATNIGNDTFSVRWDGTIAPRHTEQYTFSTLSDDGVRLWVNDQLLIDQWNDHAATLHEGKITLEAGKRYAIRMEYYENGGLAQIQLRWKSASQSEEVIPTSQLFSSASAKTACGVP
ncbi:MAG: PA14 domain-containing protein [Casimicrobium sp.]